MKEVLTTLISKAGTILPVAGVVFLGWFVSCLTDKENREAFLLHKRGKVISLISGVLCAYACYKNRGNADIVTGLVLLYVLSLPLIIADQQIFRLPKISSAIYVWCAYLPLSYLLGRQNQSNYRFQVIAITLIGFAILYLLLHRLGIGAADIYVFTSLITLIIGFGPRFAYGLILAIIGGLIRRGLYNHFGVSDMYAAIPFVPVLFNAVYLTLIFGG